MDSHLEKRGLVISLPQAILFPSGEDHVMPAAFPIVAQIAEVLEQRSEQSGAGGTCRFHPHPQQTLPEQLGAIGRSQRKPVQVLSTRYGISESRLSVQSYGSNDPKDSNDTEAGRAENRRVEILLLDESAQ